MIEGGTGGANTKTGLIFESRVDLKTLLSNISGYEIKESITLNNKPLKKNNKIYDILYNNNLVAHIFQKHAFYTFIESFGINYREIISKKLLHLMIACI